MIYCVEDEKNIRELLIYTLETTGFSARGMANSKELKDALKEELPDLILLDIMLPGEDGYSILERLKASSETQNIPVIMVTAKEAEYDKVRGLEAGADDFITKPYNIQILLARISAMLKRTHKEKVNDFLQYQGLKLQLNSSTVIYKDQIIELSKNEMRILYTLLQHKESIVSRDQLMESLWQSNEFIDDNTLTVNVNRVRKKLEAAGLKDFIKTKRGQGYMI